MSNYTERITLNKKAYCIYKRIEVINCF